MSPAINLVRVSSMALVGALLVASIGVVGGCSNIFGNQGDALNPGAPIGVYSLSGNLDPASTCAELVAVAPVPYTMTMTLRYDGTTAYWESGSSPIVGSIDAAGNVAFSSSSTTQIHAASASLQLGECDITRTDSFTGALDGAPTTDAGVASITGTLRYSYTLPAGVDCSDVVGPVTDTRTAPLFSTMPCYIGFSVTGAWTGEPASSR